MYVQNFEVIKSKILICSKALGEYLEKQNIPMLSKSSTGNLNVYMYTDEVKAMLEKLPDELRKERFFIE